MTAEFRWRVMTEHQRSNWTWTRWAAAISAQDRVAGSHCSTSTTTSRTKHRSEETVEDYVNVVRNEEFWSIW